VKNGLPIFTKSNKASPILVDVHRNDTDSFDQGDVIYLTFEIPQGFVYQAKGVETIP